MYQSHHDYCKYGPILSVVDVCYLPTTITWFTSGDHENEPMTDVIGPPLAEAYITSGRQEIALHYWLHTSGGKKSRPPLVSSQINYYSQVQMATHY